MSARHLTRTSARKAAPCREEGDAPGGIRTSDSRIEVRRSAPRTSYPRSRHSRVSVRAVSAHRHATPRPGVCRCRACEVSAGHFTGTIHADHGPFAGFGGFAQHPSLLGNPKENMKLRRLIPLSLAAYAGWKRLSPQQKWRVRNKISSASHALTSARGSNKLSQDASA
jgi:hypothetical protein